MTIRLTVACASFLGAATLVVLAQVPQAAPPKDRKDYVIEALERQKNSATSAVAMCEASYNETTAQLQKQIAVLTAENERLKKPAEPPDAAPAAK